MTQQSNAHAERRRRRRDKPGASPLGRIYAVVASPYCCAVGLALLGGLSFAEGVLLLEKTTGTWSADSARAIGVAVVVSSLLAMGIARLVPIMRGVTSASPDAVATDLTLDESEHGLGEIGRELELGRRHTGRFHGIWPAVGVLLLAVALVGFALLPLVRDEGLTRGGQLQLSTAQGTEAAWVVREGIKVRENLGGWRFELNDLDLGPLLTEGGGPEVNAKVKATLVQTGEVSEGVVTPEQPILFGDFIIRLGAVEPTPRPVGLRVQVTDTESGRQFPLSLVVGRAAQDPLGDAVFQVFEIDWDNRNGNGIAARCSLQVGKNQPPKEFWLYEADKDFDARHRKGRFQVAFDKAIAGRRATLLVSQASALEPITGVLLGLLALGTLLLFVSTQISVVRRNDRGVGALDLSSINDGEGLVIMAARLVEAPNPASASDEDDGFDDDEEGYEDDDDEDDDAYEDDEYDDDDDEYEDEDDEEYDDEDEEYEDEEYEDDDEDEDDDDEGDDDDAFDDDEDGDDDEEEVKA